MNMRQSRFFNTDINIYLFLLRMHFPFCLDQGSLLQLQVHWIVWSLQIEAFPHLFHRSWLQFLRSFVQVALYVYLLSFHRLFVICVTPISRKIILTCRGTISQMISWLRCHRMICSVNNQCIHNERLRYKVVFQLFFLISRLSWVRVRITHVKTGSESR